MTYVFETTKYRNAKDNATIYIERYSDLYTWGWGLPVWKVILNKDGYQCSTVIKDNLKNKPSKKRIAEYIADL